MFPARQAMIYDMVDNKEHLPNAIALNSSMVHAARLIGPALSGIVLEEFGASMCFLVNSLSFVAVIISLFMMRMPPYKRHEHRHKALQDLKNGFQYLRQTPSISNVMLMLACMSLVALPYITLLPVFAKDVFHGNASTFGYLNSAVGLGAFAGALFLASLQSGAVYQWIDCVNGNTPIAGATAQTYTATANGQYAVIITLGGCTDTTVCATVTNVGLNDLESLVISASPNPFNETVTLHFPQTFINKQVVVYDVAGREVFKSLITSEKLELPASTWNSAVYYISIEGYSSRLKLIKQ